MWWIPLCANKVNKTGMLLQTTEGKDEQNIVFMRKSSRTSQYGTQNVKTHSQIHINEKNNVKIEEKNFNRIYFNVNVHV